MIPSQRLEDFLTFVLNVTKAERGLLVDDGLRVHASRHLDAAVLASESFMELASQVLAQAIETGQPVIANNVVTNPDEAPTTNTAFADLRVIVGLPIARVGALYLDRVVKHGVFDRQQLERLMRFSAEALTAERALSADDLARGFQGFV